MLSRKANVESARAKTNDRLGLERAKADRLLQKPPPQAVLATDEALQESRRQTDAAIQDARQHADSSLQDRLSQALSVVAEAQQALGAAGQPAERAAVDHAVSGERRNVDEALLIERSEREVGPTPMETERVQTDAGLRTERTEVDQVVDYAGARLLDEQTAHALARLAVQRRDGFMALVSHELRNPLTSIGLNAELLAQSAGHDTNVEEIHAIAREIKTACGQMTALIGDLMDAASLETGQLRITPVAADAVQVVRSAAAASAPLLNRRGLMLTVDVPPGPVLALFDAGRVRQVLNNLLDNAGKFTPRGGGITIGLTALDRTVRVFVRDTGVGIPLPDQPHVFERFWQLGKNDRRGLGLGLYIAKAIVASHGGEMWLDSVPGTGTTFFFTLPLAG